MTRRNFFNFVAGFFAGSLLPWPRRKREPQLPSIWASDKISVVSTPVNLEMDRWAKEAQHQIIACSGVPARYLAPTFDPNSPAWKKVYTGVAPGVIHVVEIG